jgi:hypothetical protein
LLPQLQDLSKRDYKAEGTEFPHARFPQSNSKRSLEMGWVVREIQNGAKQWLKKLKEQLSKELKKIYQQSIRAFGYEGMGLAESRFNAIMRNGRGRRFFRRVDKTENVREISTRNWWKKASSQGLTPSIRYGGKSRGS